VVKGNLDGQKEGDFKLTRQARVPGVKQTCTYALSLKEILLQRAESKRKQALRSTQLSKSNHSTNHAFTIAGLRCCCPLRAVGAEPQKAAIICSKKMT